MKISTFLLLALTASIASGKSVQKQHLSEEQYFRALKMGKKNGSQCGKGKGSQCPEGLVKVSDCGFQRV